MKKALLSLALIVIAMTINAQPLVKVVIDYSKAAFDDYSEKQIKDKYGDEWTDYWENEYKPLVMEEVLDALNYPCEIKFSQEGESPYTLLVLLDEYDEDGEMDINFILNYQPVGEKSSVLVDINHNTESKETKHFTRFSTIGFVKATAYRAGTICGKIAKREGIKYKVTDFQGNYQKYMKKYKKEHKDNHNDRSVGPLFSRD